MILNGCGVSVVLRPRNAGMCLYRLIFSSCMFGDDKVKELMQLAEKGGGWQTISII